jgi:hypothetical protein
MIKGKKFKLFSLQTPSSIYFAVKPAPVAGFG